MARYEYRCEDCAKNFTIAERISQHDEARSPKCPECGGTNTRRVWSSFFAKTSSKT